MKKILLALTMCCFLCSSIKQTHAFEISPQTQTLGCGAVAIITSIGTIYCYTKKRAYYKMLEELKPYSPISQEDGPTNYEELKSYLEKKHGLYKKLTLITGGITLGVLALTSWGGYRWHNSNKCNNFMDYPDLGISTDKIEAMKKRWANLSATEKQEQFYEYAFEAHTIIKEAEGDLSSKEIETLGQAIEIMNRFSPEKPIPTKEYEINAVAAAAQAITTISLSHDYKEPKNQAFSPEKAIYIGECFKAHVAANKPLKTTNIIEERTKKTVPKAMEQLEEAITDHDKDLAAYILTSKLPHDILGCLKPYEKAYNEGRPLADVLAEIEQPEIEQ